MKTLESYIMEAGINKHLLYDIVISVVENDRTIYDKCTSIAAAIAKKAKHDERPDFDHLVESSVVDKLVVETFRIYVTEYSSSDMRLGTTERKELKKWIAARIFHILNDEMNGLTKEEITKFESNPYYSDGNFNDIYK